ncbi:protein phosphatase 2C domain-containing protein [Streptomyces longwoodensis]|uniref:protein phosphatase 2C domain-containing protein n=1 Tax=Streptomyces longwoodensis TaxID=68231 RepID=UPI0033E8FBF9
MSQQGGRPTGPDDDWWGQLYDDATADTGPTAAADSLDDRFASAVGTVNATPGGRPPREQPDRDPWSPWDPHDDTGPAPAEALPDAAPETGGPPPDVPAQRRAGPGPASEAGAGTFPAGPLPPGFTERPDPRAGAARPDGPPAPQPPTGPSAWITGTARAPEPEPPADAPTPPFDPPAPPPVPPAPPAAVPAPPPGPAEAPPAGSMAPPAPPAEAPAPPAPPTEAPTPGPGPTEAPPAGSTVPVAPSAEVPAPPAPPTEAPTPPFGPAGTPPAPPAPLADAPTPRSGPADTPPPPPPVPPAPPAQAPTPPPAQAEAPPAPPAPAFPPAPATPPAPAPATPPAPAPAPTAPTPATPPSSPGPTPGLAPGAIPAARTAPDSLPPPVRPVGPPAARGHVGARPPTYEAEPTALPAADADDLADLVPDTVLDGARYGACTLRAASLRGDSARYRGEPRRDALLTARFGAGEQALVLVAMATGARATPGAHRAAAELCRWIGRAVGRSHARLVEDIRAARRGELKSGLHRLTDRSLGRLRAEAAEQGLDPAEYAADLRCLLLPADPECRTRVFFGVGTGGLFRLRGGQWRDIEPAAGEVTGEPVVGFGSAPAGTPAGDRLTPDPGATAPSGPGDPPAPPRAPFRFRASVARPGDTLLMCTAGLADPLRGEPELSAHLAARWAAPEPPGLAAYLADVQVRVKGYADDRTAAAVWEA